MLTPYAFQIICDKRLGVSKIFRRAYTYKTLVDAIGHRDMLLKQPDTLRVQVIVIIDDWSKGASEHEQTQRAKFEPFRVQTDN